MKHQQRQSWVVSVLIFVIAGAVLTTGAVLAAADGDDENVRVAYRFSAGDSQDYKIEFSQESEFRGYSFFTLVDLEVTERCVSVVDDTLYSMEITINQVSAQMKRNDDLMDSGVDEDMAGKTFAFSLNRNGMLSNIQSKAYLEQEDEVMSIMQVVLAGSYPYLPDEDLAVGGSWPFEGSTLRDLKTDVEIESDTESTIKEFKQEKGRRCAFVKREGDSYVSGRVENQSGIFVIDGQGEDKDEFYFDVEHGCVIKVKSMSEVEIMSIDASGSSAGERETYTSNIVYNLKKELK